MANNNNVNNNRYINQGIYPGMPGYNPTMQQGMPIPYYPGGVSGNQGGAFQPPIYAAYPPNAGPYPYPSNQPTNQTGMYSFNPQFTQPVIYSPPVNHMVSPNNNNLHVSGANQNQPSPPSYISQNGHQPSHPQPIQVTAQPRPQANNQPQHNPTPTATPVKQPTPTATPVKQPTPTATPVKQPTPPSGGPQAGNGHATGSNYHAPITINRGAAAKIMAAHRTPLDKKKELTGLAGFGGFKDTVNLRNMIGTDKIVEELKSKKTLENEEKKKQEDMAMRQKQKGEEERARLLREQEMKRQAEQAQFQKLLAEEKKKNNDLMAQMQKQERDYQAQLLLQQQKAQQNNNNNSSAYVAEQRHVWEVDPKDVEMGSELGTGAFGKVYSGRLHGKEVAVKLLNAGETDEETLASFKAEVKIMNDLRHPNILLLMGACFEQKNLMIVTELMPGGGVDGLVHKPRKGFKLTFAQALKIARDCALGMNWLHNLNPPFLHLDLKLANLLVSGDLDSMNFTVKVADFGLTQMKSECTEGMVGSPFYMAPEMLLEKPFTEKVDVYSFAIVLWELITREEPYKDRFSDLEELIEAITMNVERPCMTFEMPKSARDLIVECWADQPEKRPSFKDLVQNRRIEKVIIDHTFSQKEPKAKTFWTDNFVDMWDVTWETFWKGFEKAFNIHTGQDDKKVKSLKTLLISSRTSNKLTMVEFANCLEFFGPLKTGLDLLEAIDKIAKKPWFFGGLATKDSESLLTSSNRPKGNYLIRFSSSSPGSYTLSYVNKAGKVQHLRAAKGGDGKFIYETNTFDSLDALITSAGKSLGLKNVCPGSPFKAIYSGIDTEDPPEYLNTQALKD